jgi:hypothetical protein
VVDLQLSLEDHMSLVPLGRKSIQNQDKNKQNREVQCNMEYVCMYASGKYRKEPVSVVAYAVEPHNGGQVPPLGPHHIGPAVLSTDTAGACKPSTRSVGRSILLKTESPWKKHSKTSDVQYVPERTHARTESVCWW